MNRQIEEFVKTDHFIYRQWDRDITDKLLTPILKIIKNNNTRILLVVSRRALKGIGLKQKVELFIKIDGKTLITCFYSDFQEYINQGRKEKYLIINKI